jgi:hypothetical protein
MVCVSLSTALMSTSVWDWLHASVLRVSISMELLHAS